jgi:hypothetical protein
MRLSRAFASAARRAISGIPAEAGSIRFTATSEVGEGMRIRGSKPLFGSAINPGIRDENRAWEFFCVPFTRGPRAVLSATGSGLRKLGSGSERGRW